MTDIDALRRNVMLPDVARSFGVDLQAKGAEWEACCPFHDEKTPSFTIFRGRSDGVWRFYCFGCDEPAGDVIDFVEKIKGVSTKEAIKILGGSNAGPNVARVAFDPVDVYEGIANIATDLELTPGSKVSLYNPKRKQTGSFTPSGIFPYRSVDGALIGYVLRHELPDGAKETPMVMRVRLPSGVECWSRFSFPKPRPLYGLDRISDFKQVILVEGEKCADALFRALGKPVLSWPGGVNGIAHADWSPLRGKDVIIWPDNDTPGARAALEIGASLAGSAARIRYLDYRKGIRN